jgi:tetratricopeptide (TPR) repeat protein
MSEQDEGSHKIDRLLDAIEFVKADKRIEAMPLLRQLIQEDNNFEDAWLWMSVAVENIDQSIICLDNVLRINPNNMNAANALYRLRLAEAEAERERVRLRQLRDWAFTALWVLIAIIMISVLLAYTNLAINDVPVPN